MRINQSPTDEITINISISSSEDKSTNSVRSNSNQAFKDFIATLEKMFELADTQTSQRQIKAGDTLSSIAKELQTTIAALLKLNPQISNPNVIYAGNKLNVPSQANARSATSNSTPTANNSTVSSNASKTSVSTSESKSTGSTGASKTSNPTGTSSTTSSDKSHTHSHSRSDSNQHAHSSVSESDHATPKFRMKSGIDVSGVTARANALAKEIKAKTGVDLLVTSGRRPAARQAAAMANNYANNTAPSYANKSAEAEVKAAWKSGGVPAMTRVLENQMKNGIYLSNHMKSNSIDVDKNVSVAALRSSPLVKHVGVEGNHYHVDLA
jgi:LysM repeat protein